MIVGNNLESGLTDPEIFKNDLEIERSFIKRRELLQKSCRYLNKILGVWISGSIDDLINFHGLLFNSTISDNVIEDFLSPFESLQIENVMDKVKTNLVRWVTSERIGNNPINHDIFEPDFFSLLCPTEIWHDVVATWNASFKRSRRWGDEKTRGL